MHLSESLVPQPHRRRCATSGSIRITDLVIVIKKKYRDEWRPKWKLLALHCIETLTTGIGHPTSMLSGILSEFRWFDFSRYQGLMLKMAGNQSPKIAYMHVTKPIRGHIPRTLLRGRRKSAPHELKEGGRHSLQHTQG